MRSGVRPFFLFSPLNGFHFYLFDIYFKRCRSCDIHLVPPVLAAVVLSTGAYDRLIHRSYAHVHAARRAATCATSYACVRSHALSAFISLYIYWYVATYAPRSLFSRFLVHGRLVQPSSFVFWNEKWGGYGCIFLFLALCLAFFWRMLDARRVPSTIKARLLLRSRSLFFCLFHLFITRMSLVEPFFFFLRDGSNKWRVRRCSRRQGYIFGWWQLAWQTTASAMQVVGLHIC